MLNMLFLLTISSFTHVKSFYDVLHICERQFTALQISLGQYQHQYQNFQINDVLYILDSF